MVVKNRSIVETSSRYLKVNHATFKELEKMGYRFIVSGDVIPDKVSGFKNSQEGIQNIECIPYKKEPVLKSKHQVCYALPSNKLNEMICREYDHIIRRQYLGL